MDLECEKVEPMKLYEFGGIFRYKVVEIVKRAEFHPDLKGWNHS